MKSEKDIQQELDHLHIVKRTIGQAAELKKALESGAELAYYAEHLPKDLLKAALSALYRQQRAELARADVDIPDLNYVHFSAGTEIAGNGWMLSRCGMMYLEASAVKNASVEFDDKQARWDGNKWLFNGKSKLAGLRVEATGLTVSPENLATPAEDMTTSEAFDHSIRRLPRIGDTWQHHTGREYVIEGFANQEEYALHVLHRGQDGRRWTRPLENFMGLNEQGKPRFTLIKGVSISD